MENDMSASESGANQSAATTTPYSKLTAAARTSMIATYPDKAKKIASGKLWKIEESFTLDAMGEKGKCMFPHRLSDEQLAAEIGDNPAAIFEGLSQSMIDFYRQKLDAPK
jgi:hypothetical protein